MAFHNLATAGGVKSRAPQAQTNEVFIALYNTGKTDDSLTLSIRIGGRVMQRLGWKRGDFVTVHEGSGEDSGMVQIEKAAATGRRLTDPSGLKTDPDAARIYVLTKAFSLHEFSGDPQPGESVEYEAFKGRLTVSLPKWAKPKTVEENDVAPVPDESPAAAMVGGPPRSVHKGRRSAVS